MKASTDLARIGHMATFPDRREAFIETVHHIAPQIHWLHVYCNQYSKGQIKDLEKLLPRHVTLHHGQSLHGDLKDLGKFVYTGINENVWKVILDDDMNYPPDYVDRLMDMAVTYGQPGVFGVHGRIVNPSRGIPKGEALRSYYSNTRTVHFSRKIERPQQVHIIGTGGILYHSRTVQFDLEQCGQPGMADIWFSIHCHQQDVPLVVIPKDEDWVTQNSMVDNDSTIYQKARFNDAEQTRQVNRFQWKPINFNQS